MPRAFEVLIADKIDLLVLPDTVAHADGHLILTYSYSLYKNSKFDPEKESKQHLKQNDDPDYVGTILFEQPDKLFTYEPGTHNSLTPAEVEEAIEKITHYRDTPSLWKFS